MSMYLNEHAPESNRVPGVFYSIAWKDETGTKGKILHTVEDVHHLAAALERKNAQALRCLRHSGAGAIPFHLETTTDLRNRENWEHCKHIAKELEAYASGNVYRCPECGALIVTPDDVGDVYRCPECGEIVDTDDLEQQGLGDFLEDALDIEIRVNLSGEYRSAQIMVTCGGPNIYIDTAAREIQLYWWTEHSRCSVNPDAIDELDEYCKELWNCR